jgi:hypothetical protein
MDKYYNIYPITIEVIYQRNFFNTYEYWTINLIFNLIFPNKTTSVANDAPHTNLITSLDLFSNQ